MDSISQITLTLKVNTYNLIQHVNLLIIGVPLGNPHHQLQSEKINLCMFSENSIPLLTQLQVFT